MGKAMVLKAGLLTSIQDKGRFGYRHLGVPVAGAMDQHHADLANLLLGNDKEAPLLEITITGPVIVFNEPTTIAVTGADLEVFVNNKKMLAFRRISILAGDRLSFGRLNSGCRTYLAIKQGFVVPKILGSASWCSTMKLDMSPLKRGDELLYQTTSETVEINARPVFKFDAFKKEKIVVTKGPEYHLLSNSMVQQFYESSYKILPDSNRMAYVLEGARLAVNRTTMLSSAVMPGTIQLLPDGRLIVLMRDAQTIGGYPRIFQLTEASINQLAQHKSGEKLLFHK